MKELIGKIEEDVRAAFEKAGYDPELGRVTVSNRPDLCEYQCNGAMAAAKQYHKAPFMIADEVAEYLKDSPCLSKCESVKPGFINMDVDPAFLAEHVNEIARDEYIAIPQYERKHYIVDYGGPNVAKPLHVGHLRSAVIGECIKRLGRAVGHEMTGDIHLGDWGLQIGLIITELSERAPGLVYFDENYEGEYPEEAPFTISELEEIYPTASGKSKEDEEFKARALTATHELQQGRRGYRALWEKIMKVSVADLKRNYDKLNVHFELWKAESDVQDIIPGVIDDLKDRGIAYLDNGALIVPVAQETDKKEIPPCIVLKSDGSSLYSTTDIATIVDRMENIAPDGMIYVVDKRQEMHFEQVFRVSRKAGYIDDNVSMQFLGFGTMNGKDGKPFKTRDGGTMRLENLIAEITGEMEKKINDNRNIKSGDAEDTARIVGLAALKYGDLSNQATKDYIFDMDKFTSFEGNTGPYILYTIVRIKSILEKYREEGNEIPAPDGDAALLPPATDKEKKLMMVISSFGAVVKDSFDTLSPHRLCSYIYELANEFNGFYHETKILAEPDEDRKRSYIMLLDIIKRVMEKAIDILGFEAPDKM